MDLWTDDFKWFVWFLIRSAIYGYILYHAFCFLRRKVPGVLGYGPIRKYPNMRKLRRVKGYFNYRWRRIKRKKKAGIDPIRTAFDGMKELKDCIKGLLYLVGVVEHQIRVFRTDGYR
ncbi:probable inactive ATP-dependent zinc metalloprotease FTSHI 5, chloroplastic isoform X2 [Gossypium raimondii]|uniref:probable inactive ATP-dependent zinc metalloprotease FTSHI 5, chloroplastic isoform X2 n=1 Tax=Gossypium raimondii TaxID=29730 RepID=UPI00227A4623|nr:probable inactive ATP-dependent zinc metalloprotease FTSHI 5, chloroplastic isoform X2 [Gossypium raimondii]XP_052489566.1 probable inactive ATP-dependent zinc metalloprotease FTSHI 5, chloroplastic isoform X2 [Gossypium raimondii]